MFAEFGSGTGSQWIRDSSWQLRAVCRMWDVCPRKAWPSMVAISQCPSCSNAWCEIDGLFRHSVFN